MANDDKNAWMGRVLGFDVSGTEDENSPAIDHKQLTQRLATVREDAVKLGVLQDVAPLLRDAATATKAREPKALDLVDQLEGQLAQLTRERRQAQVQQTIDSSKTASGMGVVEFNTLRLELRAARGAFDDAIGDLKAAFEMLLESDDFVDDPRSSDPATRAAINDLDKRLPSFAALADDIDDAIDKMASAGEEKQRQQYGADAAKRIAAFRRQIDGEAMLKEMESSDGGSYAIHSSMVAALDKVAAALQP